MASIIPQLKPRTSSDPTSSAAASDQRQNRAWKQVPDASLAHVNVTNNTSRNGKAPMLPTPPLPQTQITGSNKAIVKRCMNLIIAHSTAISLGGGSQSYDQIATKARTIQELALEMQKFLELIDEKTGEVEEASTIRLPSGLSHNASQMTAQTPIEDEWDFNRIRIH